MLNDLTKQLQTYIHQHPNPNTIAEEKISPVYQQLIDCITDHNHLYYIGNTPTISDKEYDELFDYIKKIEEYFPHLISGNSPTQQLVGQISEGFSQATHPIPQLSLENSYNAQDLLDRDEFITKHLKKNVETLNRGNVETSYSYILEPKFDGISVEVIYKDGKLHQAITRGDGIIGDDITQNVKTIKNLPHNLLPAPHKAAGKSSTLYLRGEIMMPKSVRKKINKEREDKGEAVFANTRNAAAGSIKLLDSGKVAERGLICYIYDVILNDDIKQTYTTHEKILDYLKDLGLPIFPWHKKCSTMQEVVDICCDPKTQEFFHTQDNDFDGLVIKMNELTNRDLLGTTEHHPRWAMAYKFPAQQASTQIESVDRQVGRTGIITPVAHLTPTQLSGVTIRRVSLHNIDFIRTKDIHLHDYVRLQRSGEVIPYITGVIKEKRPYVIARNEGNEGRGNPGQHKKDFKGEEIQIPKHCPSCSHPTTAIDMHVYCTNSACPAQLQEKLEHFVSKQCMNIEGIGESIAALLIDQKLVTTVDQLYDFSRPEKQARLRTIQGFGDKKIMQIVKELEQAKKQPLRRLLHALGIPNIGKKTAMMIQDSIQKDINKSEKIVMSSEVETSLHNNKPESSGQQSVAFSLDNLISYLTNKEFLQSIYGIGDKMIDALHAFCHDKTNITIMENLVHEGININPIEQKKETAFTGQHFSITGTFTLARETIIKTCEDKGMIFDPSPTQKSTYMLIGENPGSKKEKAEELKVKILVGREKVTQTLPFLDVIANLPAVGLPNFGRLGEVKQSSKKNEKTQKPSMQSLF